MMNIPLFDLNFDEAEEKAVIDTLRSKWITTGPKCKEFEDLFSSMLGSKYAVSLSSCTSALHLAMLILGIGEGDEVICPSLTFVATANCIKYVNATPVFCDVKSYEDLNIDPVKIKSLITERTKAIIVMHYGGFACDMDEIMRIAKEHNLRVIEDACHGPLSEYKGKKLGTIGDIGCFSFFSNKNISTGEGGMLITDNQEYYEKAKLLRSHGMTTMSFERAKGHATEYDVVNPGYNYRMDDIRASIGIVQLKKLEDDLKKRSEIRKMYIDNLCDIESIIIPFKERSEFSSNYIFPIVLRNSTKEKRNIIREHLRDAGIQTSVHYPSVHKFEIFYNADNVLPLTEYISKCEITLPMYSSLINENIEYISNKVKSYF
ncbi:MAG: DegT/DnrJ/EryC1/StrS family aminotransferase [Ignavibacteriae bacterium]|nr:DegT/DnrJ/EryC1/StrS family aminotransferase [Ignavibacteriota bacterium]